MNSKHLLKYIVILALFLFAISAIPAAAQGDGEGEPAPTDTVEPTPTEKVEPAPTDTVEPTPTDTAEPTPTEKVEPAPTDTVEPTPTDTVEPTPTDTVEPTPTDSAEVTPTETATDTVEATPTETATAVVEASPTVTPTIVAPPTVTATVVASTTLSTSDDVESAAALPGNFTSRIIAIANLNTSGASEAAQLTLDEINDTGTDNVPSPGVFPGSVSFILDSDLASNGQFSGILSSSFPAAAAVLTVNSTARTADAYPGLSGNLIASTLYATRIFNKHANFESTLICQNAGSINTDIIFDLYRDGDINPRVSVTRSNIAPGAAALVDVADDGTVQAGWAGGQGQLGFAIFRSSNGNNLACVIDSQRMVQPHVQSQWNAIPAALAGTELFVPLVFHGHGNSSQNVKGRKFNTGISILNVTTSPANVSVQFTAETGFTVTCSVTIPGSGGADWQPNTAPNTAEGWSCNNGNQSLPWSYPGPSIGAAKITSSQNIVALANSNRYDPAANNLGAGYSSVASAASVATDQVACPLAFNKNPSNNWTTGIRVANLNASGNVNVSVKIVRAGTDPATAGSSATFPINNIPPGGSNNVNLATVAGTLTNFEGGVFITASQASDKIAATSSSTNYNGLGAAALYDCLNY